MHIRIILEFFEKYQCSGIAFFLQSSRYVSFLSFFFLSNHVSKPLDCIIFNFIQFVSFSISYSVLAFHLVYLFQFLHLSLFLMFFLMYSCLGNPRDRGAWQVIPFMELQRLGHNWTTQETRTDLSNETNKWSSPTTWEGTAPAEERGECPLPALSSGPPLQLSPSFQIQGSLCAAQVSTSRGQAYLSSP